MKELRKAFVKTKINKKLKPLKITTEDNGDTYLCDHVSYFFDVITLELINSLPKKDKERYFKMMTEHEKMIGNLFGDAITSSVIFLPKALRKGQTNDLLKEYKAWLDKQ